MRLLPKSIHWCRRYPTKFNSGRDIPKAKAEDPRVKELERENARLQRRLARVETMLEIQKKTSELLGIPLNPLESDEND